MLRRVLVGLAAFGALVPSAHAAVDFAAPVGYQAQVPTDVTTGDFNADGILDLATVGSEPIATVWLGVGDGSFRAPSPATFGVTAPTGIAAARLDADADDDLAITRNGAGADDELINYLSDGDGTFTPGGGVSMGVGAPAHVALGILNNDSVPDAAVAVTDPGAPLVSIHRSNGNGTYNFPETVPLPDAPREVAIGDVNGDGDNDLAIATAAEVRVALGNGLGNFALEPEVVVGSEAKTVTITDTDRNGRGDIVAVKADGNLAVVRVSGPPASPVYAAASDQPAGGAANSVSAGDLDSDGIPDLVVANQGSEMTTLIGRGDGTFTPNDGDPAPGNPRDSVIGDFNRDGNPDAAVVSESAQRIFVFESRRPTLSFTPARVDFGDVRPSTAQTRTFRVTNSGAPTARLANVALAGPSDFSLTSNTCTSAVLSIGESCEVSVRFAPTAEGRREARVNVSTFNAGVPGVAVTGTGRTPDLQPGTCANDLNGTSRAETLNGTTAGDNIFGFGGNDVLNGLAGNDCLIGAGGNDRLNGGRGNDTHEGGSGRDVASGSTGNDRMTGGSSRDRLSGGSGRDTLNGGSSHDRLSGGSGNDRLSGSSGNDRLTGSGGNDRMTGGSGRNIYSAGSGRDTISAVNRRVDRVNCGSGRDTVRADRGDRLRGCERVRRARRR